MKKGLVISIIIVFLIMVSLSGCLEEAPPEEEPKVYPELEIREMHGGSVYVVGEQTYSIKIEIANTGEIMAAGRLIKIEIKSNVETKLYNWTEGSLYPDSSSYAYFNILIDLNTGTISSRLIYDGKELDTDSIRLI
jgi:hypothetical protein